MDSADAVSLCDLCPVASRRAAETGDLVECDCGRPWEALQRPTSPSRGDRPVGRVRGAYGGRPGPRLVYVAPDGEPDSGLAPLARAGAAARALVAIDPELVRVRRLLADLRPDCHDPLVPPLDGSTDLPPPPPMRLAGEDDWDDLPRALVLGGINASEYTLAEQRASVAAVLASLDGLDAVHAATLRWARDHATLGDGLRGLYFDAGVWAAARGLAPDGTLATWQRDLGARREGAPALGRRVLLAAAGAWGR